MSRRGAFYGSVSPRHFVFLQTEGDEDGVAFLFIILLFPLTCVGTGSSVLLMQVLEGFVAGHVHNHQLIPRSHTR